MQDYIVGIGAANVDINGRTFRKVSFHDSNPGSMAISVGGVTRNILENYCRFGGKAVLLTVLGNDVYGHDVLQKCQSVGMDVTHVKMIDNCVSSTYMSICDEKGEMVLALSDMSIMKKMDVGYLKENDELLRNAKAIVTDPSIPAEVMDVLLNDYGKDVPVFADPVSLFYSQCILGKTGLFHTLKPNRYEIEILSGIQVNDDESLIRAGEKLLEQGVQQIFVSLGKDGCLYLDQQGHRIFRKLKPLDEIANATGAGDAFMAMTVYSYVNGFDLDKTIDYCLGAGYATILSEHTINPAISLELIEHILKETKLCH